MGRLCAGAHQPARDARRIGDVLPNRSRGRDGCSGAAWQLDRLRRDQIFVCTESHPALFQRHARLEADRHLHRGTGVQMLCVFRAGGSDCSCGYCGCAGQLVFLATQYWQ